MEQEHRITYKAGITRTPSDFLCKDGELAECINLTTDNEELKPMVQPAEYITVRNSEGTLPTILYVHKYGKDTRYIGHVSNQLYWGIKSGSTLINIVSLNTAYDDTVKITSVGKTLVISSDNYPIRCFIWKNNTYSQYIDSLPPIKLSADLQRAGVMTHTGKMGDIFGEVKFTTNILEKDKEAYNDLVVGLYGENVKEISQSKRFSKPFFVCAALELFDGSYTMMTQPILMPVTLSGNVYGSIWMLPSGTYNAYTRAMKVYTGYSELAIKQETDYSAYSDLVKDVVLFVTEGIEFYDTGGDQSITNIAQGANLKDYIEDRQVKKTTRAAYPQSGEYEAFFKILKPRSVNDVKDDVKGSSVFYRLCSIGITPRNASSPYPVTGLIRDKVLENLTSQPRLDSIDFYSNSNLYAGLMYSYNNRLNISEAKRTIFPGFSYFMPFGDLTSDYTIKVEIETENGKKLAKLENATIPNKTGFWFFYPDPRAKKVEISLNGTVTFKHALEEHTGLNGACCFLGFPLNQSDTPTSDTSTLTATDTTEEKLVNYIITSEVNNPWLFKASGYNMVGTGRILAMSTITQALSQDQHGPSPLLVFSESGIWGMSVDNTGLYEYISSVSREICINPASVLQTDNAVFFVSKKGLMVAEQIGDYRNIIVRCVSEQMNGVAFNTNWLSSNRQTPLAADTPWADIISACRNDYNESFLDYVRSSALLMAYDYIDSRIIMTNPNKGYSFVYNIADGTISKTVLPAAMNNAVNNYPDYLLQGTFTETVEREGQEPQTVTHNYIYSFYEKPLEVNVSKITLAFLLTRPMKLAGPVSQASLRQLMNVGMWDKGTEQSPCSMVKTEIYVSSDMNTWYSDVSRFGAAARYFRLALYIKMLPRERLSGTILTTQERRGNNMRA